MDSHPLQRRLGRRAGAWRRLGNLAVVLIVPITAARCSLIDKFTGSGDSPPVTAKWFTALPAASQLANVWTGKPVVADGAVFFGVGGGILALDTAAGAQRWRATLGTPGGRFTGTVLVSGGSVCMVDVSGLGCANASSGAPVWTQPFDTATEAGTAAIDQATIYYGTRTHQVRARSITDGSLRWATDIAPAAPYLTIVWGVALRNDTVLATTIRFLDSLGHTTRGDVFAIDARNGNILWQYTANYPAGAARTEIQSAPIFVGNLAIINELDSRQLVALDMATGTEGWRSPAQTAGYIDTQSPPALVGDTLLAGSADTYFYGFDASLGSLLWRSPGGPASVTAVAACGGEFLLTPFGGGSIYVVDRRSHDVQRSNATHGGDDVESQIAVSGHSAYVESASGIYGLNCR